MGEDGLYFKLENLFERRDTDEFKLFQRLSAFCHDIQSKAAACVDCYSVQQQGSLFSEFKYKSVKKKII